MALTPAQEAKVLQIIEAFDNGKQINELPEIIGSVNPLDLIIEVMDGGETKQAKLASMLPYLEEQCAYGIEWDTEVSTSDCTRIGSAALHRSLPIQNRMKGCLLNDNGEVVEYLNPQNWKAHTLDGSRGQVMVEIPAHYRKFETEGTIRRCKISEYPLPGYHVVPKMYISAYEASIERSTGKLCSVVNMGTDYRGGDNQSEWDDTYRSVLGRPVTKRSRTQFRAAARLRNASATSEWNCLDYNAYKAVFWLYYVEYANRNCQLPFNAQKGVNGYAQGGLGIGIVNISDAQWRSFNGYHSFVPCGHTDDIGNFSGEVAYDIIGDEGTLIKTTYSNRYRGIENPFGHIWKLADGINIQVASDADGGLSKVFIADNPADYNDSDCDNYTQRGVTVRINSFVKEIIFGEFGDIVPAIYGGSTTTYWCDFNYTAIPESGITLRAVLLGGTAYYGMSAGLCFTGSHMSPSDTHASFGSRLCFIPQL